MGADESIVDIAGGNYLQTAAVPNPDALSTKVNASRAVGIKGYNWPPSQCKATIGKNWWFCPSDRKCAKSQREYGAVAVQPAQWGNTLGTKGAHQMPAEPQQHIVEVTHRNAKREVERYIYMELVLPLVTPLLSCCLASAFLFILL